MTAPYNYGAIYDWRRYVSHDGLINYQIRSTPVHRGGYADFSARRYSMIIQDTVTNEYTLQIATTAYKSHWDSEDPDQAFKKYLAGEWNVLLSLPDAKMYKVKDPNTWDGQAQTMKLYGETD